MPFTTTPLACLAALTLLVNYIDFDSINGNACPPPLAAPTAQRPARGATSASAPGDSLFKGWYFTPGGVFGRLPLRRPRSRSYIRLSHPAAGLAEIETINPAGVTVNTTRIYFRNGLISLATETDRWGDTFDSTWFQPEGAGKFLVTRRTRGVNPYLPSKFKEFTFKDDLLTDIVGYVDSLRAAPDQKGVEHYSFERYSDPIRRGLIRSESYFGELDVPITSRGAGCHKIVNDYDEKGNLAAVSIYDEDDKPIVDRNGVFLIKYKYDGDDNETEAQYFNTSGKPTVTTSGYAYRIYEYRHGFLTEESYLSSSLQHVIAGKIGNNVFFVDHSYDRQGNQTETSYYDADHYPVAAGNNLKRIANTYSPNGMLIRTDFVRLLRPETEQTFLSVKYDRDEKGRIVTRHYEMPNAFIVTDPEDGAYFTKLTYDERGRIHSSSCWANDSTRMSCSLGYHEIIYHYDEDGQLAERDFFDEYGRPSGGRIGYSRELLRRNALGLPAERSYFLGDRPALMQDSRASVSNFHRLRYDYDQLNRLRSVGFFDRKGRPVDAMLRTDSGKTYKVREVSLDYNGDALSAETLKDSGETREPLALDCSKGECIAIAALENLTSVSPRPSALPLRQYHGRFSPDSIFANQLGFLGRDSVLVFVTLDWGAQTDFGCGVYYRVAPVNKYYQLDGRVADYYMENDSLAATFSYVKGLLEGPVYLFYPNGRIRERGIYRNNLPYGNWDYYYDNGQKQRTLVYQGEHVFVQDCYARNGDVLAQNGNGSFEGLVGLANSQSIQQVMAKGKIRDGAPDAEWNLYLPGLTRPWATEYFNAGKFRYGISYSALGNSRYTDVWHTTVEAAHGFELLDHYRQDRFCRVRGVLPLASENYTEIRKGVVEMLKTNKYKSYSGWIALDLLVDTTGRVASTRVHLYEPNADLERDLRTIAAGLRYSPLFSTQRFHAPFEKLYIILISGNDMVVPEELLDNQRRRP
ncbi:MAG TPA: hypothetical protein VN616_06695 [Puia sp.]|nr:hypothetical protein [Puia sp.]